MNQSSKKSNKKINLTTNKSVQGDDPFFSNTDYNKEDIDSKN